MPEKFCHRFSETEKEKVLVFKMKYKIFPMGAAASEKMERKGLTAHLSHAVMEPCFEQVAALCGVKTFSLCMDDSLTEVNTDCPKCKKRIDILNK